MGNPKHPYSPFDTFIADIRARNVARWSEVQAEFLRVVESFDTEYRAGNRDSGWYQAKARYFNDVIVTLLENLSGKPIATRKKKNSQLFGELDVDICFPDKDAPQIAGEVKALGTPPHPNNKNRARNGSSDLHKRVREVALTSIDLKVAYSGPQPIQSFQHWIDSTPPGYFSFWAIRANNESDFERVRSLLSSLRSYCNGVGAFIYSPDSSRSETSYEARRVLELDIDRSIREMAQRIS